jgi:hypothetical protein
MAERRPKRSPTRERGPLLNTNINCQRPKNSITKSKLVIMHERWQLDSLIFSIITKIVIMDDTCIDILMKETSIFNNVMPDKGINYVRDIGS